MDTALRRRCQTACLAALLAGAALGRGQTPAPIPAWQNELNAARLLAAAAEASHAPDAGRVFRDLAANHPANAAVQKACGEYFWNAAAPDEALPYWQTAQTLAPGDADLASSLGSAYLRLARIKDAAAQFERAVKAAPGNALYHYELANLLAFFRHEFDGEPSLVRALAEYRRAAELAADDRRLAQEYADTFYLLARPDWESALAAWLAVRRLSGDATDFPNVHLARISLHLGRADDARAYLDQLKDPAFTTLRDKLRARADALQRNSSANPSR